MIDIQKTQTLQVIRYLESNDGKYTNHASSAKGDYGIMPKFLADAKKSFSYKSVKLTDHAKASICYDFIVKTIGTSDPKHVAYAWLNGPYKLGKIPYRRADIRKHWYVKRFTNLYTETPIVSSILRTLDLRLLGR